MSVKNPLTPAGIEPATYRFVAQHLNQCYRGPRFKGSTGEKSTVTSYHTIVISCVMTLQFGEKIATLWKKIS